MSCTSVRWRRIGLLGVFAAALWLGHRWLLAGLARPLIADQSPGEANFACLFGNEQGINGEGSCDEAARWYREAQGRQILLLEPWSSRLVETHIVPSFEELARRELGKRGVPRGDIHLIPGQARDAWERACLLKAGLQKRPESTVVLLCDRFHSAQTRSVLNRVLAPAEADRVRVQGPPGSRYDENDWWKSRAGTKGCLFGWLGRVYAWGYGEGRVVPRWLPTAEYRSLVEKTYGEAP